MLVLHNVMMEPSNVTKKKGTTKCNKSIVKCDVKTAERENEIIKCEKKKEKKREPPNVTKEQSHMIWNYTM